MARGTEQASSMTGGERSKSASGGSAMLPRLGIARLADMNDGQTADFFVLLVSKEQRQTRAGKPFYTLTMRDRERKVSIPIWSDSEFFAACEHEWQPGQFFKVRGTYRNTEWGPQIEIERVRLATDDDRTDGFDPANFAERTRFDTEKMFQELKELAAKHISDEPLQRLVLTVLQDYESGIKQIPAATHNHHAFVGGYLEHVLSVTRTAVFFADKYAAYYPDVTPSISKSLVVAGAILHDIGKLRELDTQAPQAVYSIEGRLLGHMILGRDIVRELAPAIEGFSPHTQLLLEHIIAAHQGQREWGAVVEPQTIECLLVHYADDLDAKVNMMAEALQKDSTPGPFTSRENPLRRNVFKGAAASDAK